MRKQFEEYLKKLKAPLASDGQNSSMGNFIQPRNQKEFARLVDSFVHTKTQEELVHIGGLVSNMTLTDNVKRLMEYPYGGCQLLAELIKDTVKVELHGPFWKRRLVITGTGTLINNKATLPVEPEQVTGKIRCEFTSPGGIYVAQHIDKDNKYYIAAWTAELLVIPDIPDWLDEDVSEEYLAAWKAWLEKAASESEKTAAKALLERLNARPKPKPVTVSYADSAYVCANATCKTASLSVWWCKLKTKWYDHWYSVKNTARQRIAKWYWYHNAPRPNFALIEKTVPTLKTNKTPLKTKTSDKTHDKH
jgi:hypothetical protein